MTHPPDGTLRLPDADARTSVIPSLQATTSPPGKPEHDQAELAISPALSPERAADNPAFLMRNVQRDARRILNHQPHREVQFSTLEHAAAAGAKGDEPKSLEDLLPPSREPGPDEVAQAAELEERIRTVVGPVAQRRGLPRRHAEAGADRRHGGAARRGRPPGPPDP